MRAFLLLLLVGIAAAAPTSSQEDDVVKIDGDFFPSDWVKYTSQHDIVNILLPINSINFEEDASSSESNSKEDDIDSVLFFVEADIINGKKDYKGVSVLQKNKATKLVENGRDMAASGDDSKKVFIGASDGIYVYNHENGAVSKYGSVNENIYGIVHEKTGDVMYILTANKDVYKVSDSGNVMKKLEDVVNAEQIMLDYSNNLYFYGSDKKPYVRTSEGVKEITGLPEHPKYAYLLKPAFVLEDCVPFVADNVGYIIYANGTSETADVTFEKSKYRPTAYSMEAAIVQYYALDKKIYEYNVLAIILGSMLEELKSYLDDKKNVIQEISSNRKSSVKKYI